MTSGTAGVRGALHHLVDELPPDELHAAQRFLAFLRPPAPAAPEPEPAEVQSAEPAAGASVDEDVEPELERAEVVKGSVGEPSHDYLLTSLRRGIEAVDRLVEQERRDLQRIPGMERSIWRLRVDNARVLIRLNTDGSVRIVTTRPAPELRRERRLECGAEQLT